MTDPERSWKIRGRPQTGKREQYVTLLAQGYSNSAACRLVGIDRRTGTRWRYGRVIVNRAGARLSYPPILPAEPPRSTRYLSEDERVAIADRRLAGDTIRAIAARLHRSPSTISREVGRNADEGSGRYHPHRAEQRARARRARPKQGKLVAHHKLRDYVQSRLERRWSPEQISRTLPHEFPDGADMRVAPETVYQALYRQAGLQRELTRALRTGRACRRPRRRGGERRARFADPMVGISQRPLEVADRTVPGHWEGDLIMGAGNRSAIGTLVERTTRYLLLLHLPHGHAAERVRDALLAAVGTLPAHLTRSLTWDQGVEMGRHREFQATSGVAVYFCDRGSPWQRGSNENTNGLLRQYFPKGTDLRVHTTEKLAAVATELNTRPRKSLDWNTPAQRLANLLAAGS